MGSESNLDKKETVFVVSDSVGETADLVVKAVTTQFNGGQLRLNESHMLMMMI